MKTITMYELIGLIKDGKAPCEIIYKNSKYFIDELEGYYKREDGKPLFEHIFDNYNDYDALQVKIEILPEENDEWEDIEELNYTLPTKHEHGKLFYKDGHNNTLRQIDITILEKINSLIKNQKYLKERLDNVKDDVVFDYWKDKVESKDVY